MPVTYLEEVTESKIFGFIVTSSVNETIKRTWKDKLKKMRGKFIEWAAREIPTLHQRGQVVNTYMASTIWYTAQVIQLPQSTRQQMNSEISRFIFKGRITMGRLTLAELCHPVKAGGLGLVDIQKKADTLLLRQTCRMVSRKGAGYNHISYWLSSQIQEKLALNNGPRSLTRPPKLQQYILQLVLTAREKMSEKDLLNQTAKMLYQREAEDLPAPRLQRRNLGLEMEPVWQRLSSPVLAVSERHGLFILAHQLLRNKEDMFLKWGQGEYTCNNNPDPDGRCAGQPGSVKHLLQECTRVAGALRLPGLLPASSHSNRDGLHHPALPQPGKQAIRRLCDLATWLVYSDSIGGDKWGECGGRAGTARPIEAEICSLQLEKDASTKSVQYVRRVMKSLYCLV